MNSKVGTDQHSWKSTEKSNAPEKGTTSSLQHHRDLVMLEDDIQRYHNKLAYDRSLTAEQAAELRERLARKEKELQHLKNLI